MFRYSGFLREKDSGNHHAQNAAEQEQRTQNGKQFCDQRLAGLLLKYRGEGSVRQHIVIQEIGKHKDRQCQHKGPQGQLLKFLLHNDSFLSLITYCTIIAYNCNL